LITDFRPRDEIRPAGRNPDVLEQSGRIEPFSAESNFDASSRSPGRPEIGADGVGVDAAVALDVDPHAVDTALPAVTIMATIGRAHSNEQGNSDPIPATVRSFPSKCALISA